ncbi:MAG: hypothetical protein HXY19_01580 [Thermoanaerobaculaceae bacterium]|nr:hypothetical protein [Thermoanaerobaculaceae bacterium]
MIAAPPLRTATLLAAGLLATATSAATAQNWSATTVQWLHGHGFELGPSTLSILTLEHVSGWRLGSNFFFFDVTQPAAAGTAIYGEWYSRLSWHATGLRHESPGYLRDVSFAAALNAGNGFRAYLAGVTLHFRVRGFSFLDLDVMAYDDRSNSTVTYILTPAWEVPLSIGKAALRWRGFVDFIGPEGQHAAQVLAQPQLLLELGSLLGKETRLAAGLEYQYWRHKYGVKGVVESVPQLLLLWQF